MRPLAIGFRQELAGFLVGVSFGFYPLCFCIVALRLLDIENEAPGVVTVLELKLLGLAFEIWYCDLEGYA